MTDHVEGTKLTASNLHERGLVHGRSPQPQTKHGFVNTQEQQAMLQGLISPKAFTQPQYYASAHTVDDINLHSASGYTGNQLSSSGPAEHPPAASVDTKPVTSLRGTSLSQGIVADTRKSNEGMTPMERFLAETYGSTDHHVAMLSSVDGKGTTSSQYVHKACSYSEKHC